MVALARDCLLAGTDVILEGNFRPGEYEAPLSAAIADANISGRNDSNTSDPDAPHAVRVTQILCRTPEPVRIARLKARRTTRHVTPATETPISPPTHQRRTFSRSPVIVSCLIATVIPLSYKRCSTP
jgi:hypothetical protein